MGWTAPVLVVPPQPVIRQTVRVYVLAEDLQEQAAWEVAVQERLNREGDRLPEVLFLAEPYPAGGRLKTDLPAIIVQQAGAVFPWKPAVPVVKLAVLPEVERLLPGWIYALAMDQALRGVKIGPVLEVIPVEDGFAVFV